MKKSDLIKIIAKQHPKVSQQQIAFITEEFFHQLSVCLAQGKRVELRGLGSFDSRSRPPRMSRNPRTGQSVSVSRQRVPFFRLGRKLKELLQIALKQSLAEQSYSVAKNNSVTTTATTASSGSSGSSSSSDHSSSLSRSRHVKDTLSRNSVKHPIPSIQSP